MSEKFAVVAFGARQYLVHEGLELLIDKASESVATSVLLYVQGENFKLGKPHLTGAKVKFSVVKEIQMGDKIRGFKYKAKSRYRKRFGFRPQYTRIKVLNIEA